IEWFEGSGSSSTGPATTTPTSRLDLDHRRHRRSSYALLRLARRPQDPRRDRDRRGVGDGNGPTLIGRLVRIARCAVLAANDLHLRGHGPDDGREGEAVV